MAKPQPNSRSVWSAPYSGAFGVFPGCGKPKRRNTAHSKRFARSDSPPPKAPLLPLRQTFCFVTAGILLALSFSAIAALESGEDWAHFLGPRSDGTSTETGLLEQWPTN